ncbi:hypothetical protein [Chryseobacterium sp. Bi04]|uniref:hypothetical protein n=1 Tax=Chryseobacterium sp. Bi04 TaxID=2822345 RepID=UPI001D9A0AB5|nr:hypothetical protein [Chryseobacterium sp. Bi04]CAH0209902.1 hypothetical protein SRABI04_02200 [Chryseobacterium sp. Bi04]
MKLFTTERKLVTHYYPFGLEFGGELGTSNSITPNYTYSSQGRKNNKRQDGVLTDGGIMMLRWAGFSMLTL